MVGELERPAPSKAERPLSVDYPSIGRLVSHFEMCDIEIDPPAAGGYVP
jgi:hypothetical protein